MYIYKEYESDSIKFNDYRSYANIGFFASFCILIILVLLAGWTNHINIILMIGFCFTMIFSFWMRNKANQVRKTVENNLSRSKFSFIEYLDYIRTRLEMPQDLISVQDLLDVLDALKDLREFVTLDDFDSGRKILEDTIELTISAYDNYHLPDSDNLVNVLKIKASMYKLLSNLYKADYLYTKQKNEILKHQF